MNPTKCQATTSMGRQCSNTTNTGARCGYHAPEVQARMMRLAEERRRTKSWHLRRGDTNVRIPVIEIQLKSQKHDHSEGTEPVNVSSTGSAEERKVGADSK